MLDKLVPQIERAAAAGAVVVLKWDGKRAERPCTVVLTHESTGFTWRQDSDDMVTSLRLVLDEYNAAHKA